MHNYVGPQKLNLRNTITLMLKRDLIADIQQVFRIFLKLNIPVLLYFAVYL